MKCNYCNGEVSAEALSCPFCGNINEEGVRFQQEVQEKIKRNKLLAPLLLKQKTPELVEKLLERMILVCLGIFVVGMAILCGIFLLEFGISEGNEREAVFHYAKELEQAHGDAYASRYNHWMEYRDVILDKLENGAEIQEYETGPLFNYAFDLWNYEKQDDPYYIKGKVEIEAMFIGILDFSDEEMKYFTNYEYYWEIEETEREALYRMILERLQEAQG